MKHSEASALLAKISAYDRRTVGEADVEAWREALDEMVTLQDAMTAVRDHFRASDDWLMPKHIIDRARVIRRERIRNAGVPDYPANLTAAQEREWLDHYHASLSTNGRSANAVHDAMLSADMRMGVSRTQVKAADPERVKQIIAEGAKRFAIESAAREAQWSAEMARHDVAALAADTEQATR